MPLRTLDRSRSIASLSRPLASPPRPTALLFVALCALFALTAPLSASALDRPTDPVDPPVYGETVEVREVLFDVQVVDKQGQPIVGLGKDDFRVTVDGRPVEVSSAAFYSSRAYLGSAESARAQGIAEVQAPDRRYFVLFFDDQREESFDVPSLLGRQLDAGRRAVDWIPTLGPNDYVAVAAFTKKLEVYSDFTRDRIELERAITLAAKGDRSDLGRSPRAEGAPSLVAALPKGNALRAATPTVYEALSTLAEATGGIVGRKNLVLFSIGFGRVDPFGQYQPDNRYLPPMLQALNANNVAVYTVDLLPPTSTHPFESALGQLANETGGRFLDHAVSFAAPLASIGRETQGYYLLSLKTEVATADRDRVDPKAARYQRVEVRATDPSLSVKARQGYRFGG